VPSDVIQRAIASEGGGPLSSVAAINAFDGCMHETDVAAFIVAHAAEQRVRGMFWGLMAGVAGSVALAIYLKSKGYLK